MNSTPGGNVKTQKTGNLPGKQVKSPFFRRFFSDRKIFIAKISVFAVLIYPPGIFQPGFNIATNLSKIEFKSRSSTYHKNRLVASCKRNKTNKDPMKKLIGKIFEYAF